MKSQVTLQESYSFHDQLGAAAVDAINKARIADEILQKTMQDVAFEKALSEIEIVRGFIDKPENILGSDATKHGEIAEVVEVGVRRARDLVMNAEPTATFEGVGRTAAADLRIDGFDVQSKFINGTNKGLSHVLEHMRTYDNFGRDGSFYLIPKNQHEEIIRVLNGDTGDLSKKTVDAIFQKVQDIEAETGKSFHDVVKPSVSKYADVQQNQVNETLNKHEDDLSERNDKRKEQISQDHEASLAEGLKATFVAGAVGASVGFTSAAYRKYKEGKNIFKGDFTIEDWKDIGSSTLTAGVGGGLTGAAIYALTNCAALSAPFAGAVVSAVKGIKPLVADYRNGKITFDEFLDAGMFVCSDVAIVGLCTAAGQALIPVPVLGAVLGSIAGKFLSTLLSGKVRGAKKAIEERMNRVFKDIDKKYQKVVDSLLAQYHNLGNLTVAAFDLTRNLSLVQASLDLARAHGVNEKLLLKNEADLDRFMLD